MDKRGIQNQYGTGLIPVFLLLLLLPQLSHAQVPLPYAVRTHAYSAWDTTLQGDDGMIGMAGATSGMLDTRFTAVDNPSSLPVLVDNAGFQITGNSRDDGYIQSYDTRINTQSILATFCPFPWGVSFVSWFPQSAGDAYWVNGAAQQLSVETRENQLSFANLFVGPHLSLGISVIVGENTQSFTPAGGATVSETAMGYGLGFGALYELPDRVMLGLSFIPPIHYGMSSRGQVDPALPGFFQDANAPFRLGVGAGWVPSRFFQTSFGLYFFGPTASTALLSDDAMMVGGNLTLQPRLGVSYRLLEYKDLLIQMSAGSYLEVIREDSDFSRLHGTLAMELKPWVFNFGWGLDEARLYENFIFSAGIDVHKILVKLNLIPRDPPVAAGGLLPNPLRVSDAGLPHAFQREHFVQRDDNIFRLGAKMPERLRDEFLNAPLELKAFGGELWDTIGNLPSTIQGESLDLWRRTMGVEPRLGEEPSLETP